MLMIFTVNARAQVQFGVKGGLNLTNVSLSSDVFDTENRVGFFVGPTLKFALPIGGLGIDVAGLYDQKNLKIAGESITQKSVLVPVNLRLNLGLGSTAAIYLAAGPQLGFNVGDDEFNWKDTDTYDRTFRLKNSAFSVNLGGGIMINHLEIGLTYNIACGKTGDVTYTGVRDTVEEGVKTNTNAWQISAALYF